MYSFFIIFAIVALLFADVLAPIHLVKFKNADFSRHSLQNEEKILSISKTHWFVLLKIIVIQILILSIFLPILVNLIQVKKSATENVNQVPHGFIFFTLLGIWLLFALRKQVLFWCREFVVTDKRIVAKRAILKEFRYNKIESCIVVQSFWGRLLGYGSIIIRGVGGSEIIEQYIANPFTFRQYIVDILENKKDTIASEVNQLSANQGDSIEKLRAYKKLLDEGVISEEDFEMKKQKILSEE